jgi:hypothetical protein
MASGRSTPLQPWIRIPGTAIRFLDSRLVRAGLALFVIGCGPLLLIILADSLGLTPDPEPNPVLFGMMALLTFWPSIGLVGAGILATLIRERNGVKATTAVPRHGPGSGAAVSQSSGSARLATGSTTADVATVNSWKAIVHGPLGRGAAAVGGVVFIIQGMTAPDGLANRGAASAVVLGGVAIWFAAAGRLPNWFRRWR